MDTSFGEENVTFHSESQTLDFDRTNNILCPDGFDDSYVNTDYFNTDQIDDAMLNDNCVMQTIESTYYTDDEILNELNRMTRAEMESGPYAETSQYLTAVSSSSDNFMKMDQGQQMKQELGAYPRDIFECNDDERQQMSQEEFQDYFDVIEEFVVQKCPEEEITTQNWDLNNSASLDTILNGGVGYMSAEDDDIPIIEEKEVLSSVNLFPCNLCNRKFKQKQHLEKHMIIHPPKCSFYCAICGISYQRKCDFSKHMKMHNAPDAALGDGTDKQNTLVSKSMNELTLVDSSVNSFGRGRGKGRGIGRRKGGGRVHPKKNLDWHSKLYSKPHTCNPCRLSFTRERTLLQHARIKHISDSVNIITNQKSNSDTRELTILANFNSNEVSYTCDSCVTVFERFDLFKRHQIQHKKKELINPEKEIYREAYLCIQCGLTSKIMSLLELDEHTENHLDTTYIPKASKCLQCGEIFQSVYELSDHVVKMHADSLSEYSCKICAAKCENDKALQKHLMIHDKPPYKCTICAKMFNFKSQLTRHMVSHQRKGFTYEGIPQEDTHEYTQTSITEKIFPCTRCDKVFSSRSCQQIHVRIHTGERPYDCSFCDKAFADGGSLRKHERIHTGEKPYVCPVCQKAFNQRVVVREHIRSHHAGLEGKSLQLNYYVCKVCGQLFGSSTALCTHLIRHSDENTAKSKIVPIGPRKYKRRSNLRNEVNTWCLVEKVITVMSGQSDTENNEDKPMPIAEEEAVHTVMDEGDLIFNCNFNTEASSSQSPVKAYKVVNSKLVEKEKKSSKKKPNASKSVVTKPNIVTKKQRFALKKGECSRTCSTALYYSSKLNPAAMDSPLEDKSKENDNPDEPNDSASVDVSYIESEPINEEQKLTGSSYNNICEIEYNDQGIMEYYIQNNDEYFAQADIIQEAVNDDCLIKKELVFDTDYIDEVGAYIELSTEEMAHVYTETICSDDCDEVFEDRREHIRHI